MGSLSFGGSHAAIGLDIGTDHVRVAQLRPSGSTFSLAAYGRAEIPMGAVVDGEIVDPGGVSQAIRELWRRSGVSGKVVATGVSNQRVIVRLIELPFMEQAELRSAIQYQAQDYIPMAVEDSVLDFQIIGERAGANDEHMMEVLLVAAHRDMIGNTVAAVEGAGLKLDRIDVSSFAIVRALLGDGFGVLPEEGGTAIGVIHISSGLTNITVVEGGVPRFNRVSSLAGNTFTHAIASALNVSTDQAEELKVQAGLPSPDAIGAHAVPGLDARTAQVVHEALEREVNKFIAEVRRSLDFYLTQNAQARSIQRVLLTGSGAQLANLDAYLARGLQARVEFGDPLGRIKAPGGLLQAVSEDRLGAVTAIGLALGGVQS